MIDKVDLLMKLVDAGKAIGKIEQKVEDNSIHAMVALPMLASMHTSLAPVIIEIGRQFSKSKFEPETDREKMLVEALLRKCRGQDVEVNCLGGWASDEENIDIDCEYRVPPTKADLILEEVTKNMDESAAAVVMEAMSLSPTLKGLCDE